jgi:hypothetical protein
MLPQVNQPAPKAAPAAPKAAAKAAPVPAPAAPLIPDGAAPFERGVVASIELQEVTPPDFATKQADFIAAVAAVRSWGLLSLSLSLSLSLLILDGLSEDNTIAG